jgi:hypothetical protein
MTTPTSPTASDGPVLRVLSLGAGVQSTALLILAATHPDRERWGLDAAIFADTGWEPDTVYAHLARLEAEIARPAGIPIYRVSAGNLRDDALDPGHRFASMPLYVANPDGTEGMGRRQCTSEYKLKPILAAIRGLLGAPNRPGRVPGGAWVQQWIGISTDESHRALSIKSLGYARARFPLLEPSIAQGLSRTDCAAINTAHGFPDVPKSACIGCPFHSNAQWRAMRDHAPTEWANAVAFDAAIRHGHAAAVAAGHLLRGYMFLHRSRRPLDFAPIDHITAAEWATRQGNLLDLLTAPDGGEDEPRGCSPFGCRADHPDPEPTSPEHSVHGPAPEVVA